mmetsp:Transcript_17706/g.41057  ORF Transcript_17706/g.41057 Transcript_17706/m.41057 type:complete len:236 (+) Transcript_17706:3-710(+)
MLYLLQQSSSLVSMDIHMGVRSGRAILNTTAYELVYCCLPWLNWRQLAVGAACTVVRLLAHHVARRRWAILWRRALPLAIWLLAHAVAILLTGTFQLACWLRASRCAHGTTTSGACLVWANHGTMWLLTVHRARAKVGALAPGLATWSFTNWFADLVAFGSLALPSALWSALIWLGPIVAGQCVIVGWCWIRLVDRSRGNIRLVYRCRRCCIRLVDRCWCCCIRLVHCASWVRWI